MLLIPDPRTAIVDPIYEVPTLSLICTVVDPLTRENYTRDPRWVAMKAESHLLDSGVATVSLLGSRGGVLRLRPGALRLARAGVATTTSTRKRASGTRVAKGRPNLGHRPRFKQGYFPCPPTDTFQDFRSRAVLTMRAAGIAVEAHHHEVGTAGQAEIDLRFAPLTTQADQLQLYKFIVKNLARREGKTATFMPKPIFNDNGSGMHVHQSLWQDDSPSSSTRPGYAQLSRARAELHRRPPGPRARAARLLRAHHQLLPPAGAGLRGPGQPGLLPAQPLRLRADPDLLDAPRGQAGRVPLPRSLREPVPGVRRHAHGRPGRHRAAGSTPVSPSTRTSTSSRRSARCSSSRRPASLEEALGRSRRTTSSCSRTASSRRT